MKITLTVFYPVPRNPQFWHHFCPIRLTLTLGAILITSFISHWKDDITGFHIKNASNKISYSVNRERVRYLANDAFCVEQKSDKMDKSGAILIIIVEGYSILMYLFDSIFFCFVDSVVFFMQVSISSKTIPAWDKPPGGHDLKGAKILLPGQSLCTKTLLLRQNRESKPHPRDTKLENFTNISLNSDTIWNEKLCGLNK